MPDVVNRSPRMPAPRPDISRRVRLTGMVRSVCQSVWRAAVRVIWDDTVGGIDETALPSGFAAPQRRGSRMVRNLWHIPF